MARVIEEYITVKVSKLVRDNIDTKPAHVITDEFVEGIEAMAQELLDDSSAIIEVSRMV